MAVVSVLLLLFPLVASSPLFADVAAAAEEAAVSPPDALGEDLVPLPI